MNDRRLNLRRTLVLLLAVMACAAAGTLADDQRPNILFFMADDMGLGDVRVYDPSSTIPTPHMDRLAAEGIRFTDAHSPSSVCTPTRYSVLTGRYPFRSTLRDAVLRSAYDPPLLDAAHETVAGLMQRAGYRTAAFGKWHLGMSWTNAAGAGVARPGVGASRFSTRDVDFTRPILDGPTHHGFDYFFGIGSSINHGPYTFIENTAVSELPTRFREQIRYHNRPFREGWIAPSWDDTQQGVVTSGKALDFVRRHVADHPDQPFFIYYAATANHWPYAPPEHLRGEPVRGRGGHDNDAGPRNDMVVQNDLKIGQFLALFDDHHGDGDPDRSITRKTLVIVTSDNGACIGHYEPIRDKKGSIYEGGHRVPLIVRWPGRVPAGAVSDQPVSLVDLYATLAALTGTKPAPGAAEDSHNILPALLGRPINRGPMIQTESGAGPVFAIRDGSWKLIIRRDQPAELYRLDRDLKEQTNLIDDHPDRVARLMQTFRLIRGE
jgi:arylsulfatase A